MSNTSSQPNERSEAYLRDRRSWPAWFLQLQFDSTFRNIWQYVDPSAPDAPHLIAVEPTDPPTIEELIASLNDERTEPTRAWDADGRPEEEKGRRPRAPVPAKFDDIKEEHSARLKSYSVQQVNWVQRSARYQHMWNWVRASVDEDLLRPHLETLVREDRISLQNVVRRLQAQFAPSDDISADRARQEYRRTLDVARHGSINPQRWYQDWNKALSRARTYRIPEIDGFLATKDFLEAISVKLVPVWGSQQLADVVVAKELGEPVRTLDQYGRAFESLIQHASFLNGNSGVFATLGGRSDGRSERGYLCPCKETRDERHPWKPADCSILELAIRGVSTRAMSSVPSTQELDAVRERLQSRQFTDLRTNLEKKGWPVDTGSSGAIYPGSVTA